MTKAKTTITPLGFNVLVEIVPIEDKSKGGIILPSKDEKQLRSELVKIISHGESAFTDCFGKQYLPTSTTPYALIQRNAGHPLYLDGSKTEGGKLHRLVQSDHILAVMNEEDARAFCHNNLHFEFKSTNKE